MRVGNTDNDVTVKLELVGNLFGKITGESGKEWEDPNSQPVGGN